MGYNIGPKIGIDGEREFRKQLSQINNAYKTLTAETKAATAAFDANGDEQGKLRKTGEQLQKQIDLQQKKVSLLSDMVQKATAKFGENSDEVTRLKGVMYDAQASLSGLEGELKDVNQKLKDDTKAVEDFGNEAGETQEKIVDFGDILAANFLSDALYDGLQELSGKLKDIASDSIQAAADVAAETAQFEQTFGDLKDTANGALESISDTTHIAVTRLQGSYTKLYAFAKTVGAEQEQALDISSRALIAAADSAAYYDHSIDETLESLQAFLKGNYANDAALGIAATETTRNTMANKLYAKSFNELSESQKVETLLAMVEAGNAASGAMGQAAREADNWTNVTGELNEAFRQLLAKAGTPVLKKITPVVQDITESLYDIAEDINWDKFSDTVSAIIDLALKNLPKITKGLTSIGVGFAALKLTNVIVSITKTAAALVNVATSAGTAGAAFKGMAVAMNTTPWGLIASAIGLVAGGITAIALNTQQTQSELSKAMDSFTASMEQVDQAYQLTVQEVNTAAYAADFYIDRLKELETAGLNTNEAQQEYAMCIEQLNGLIPDLNLTIDEQTGLLEQNADAIKADIDAWQAQATQQALIKRYTDTINARAEAEATLLELQSEEMALLAAVPPEYEEYLRLEKEKIRLDGERVKLYNKLTKSAKLTTEQEKKLREEDEKLGAAWNETQDRLYELQPLYDEWKEKLDDAASKVSAQKEAVSAFTPVIEKARRASELFAQTTKTASSAQQTQTSTAYALTASVEALTVAYDETYAEAEESLSSQINLWEELKTESDYTAESIVENWNKQKKAFENYDKNLRAAVNKGLDPRLIQELSDGSQESMMILDKLVNDVNYTVDEINAAFGERLDAAGNIADTLAAVNLLDMPEAQRIKWAAQQMGFDVIQALKNVMKTGGILSAEALLDGIDAGIISGEGDIIRTVAKFATNAIIGTLNSVLRINSPSKESEESLSYFVDGGVLGVKKNAYKLEKQMTQLGDSTATALLSEKLRNVSEHIASIGMPSTTTNTSIDRRSYGGFYFTINQLPGENANDLADRVMEKIQSVVDQKGAVWNA